MTLFDLARRVDLKRVGKRPLEMLARAGAFDQLDANRRRVFDSLEALVGYSAAIHEQKNSDQVSLFGEAGDDLPEPRLSPVNDWLPAERLAEEFKAIGFYLSGHPLDDYMAPLKRKGVLTLDQLLEKVQQGACIAKLAGVVAGRQERKSARGNRFAFAQLSDTTGAYEVTLFSETLEKSRDYLETGAKVVVTVEATLESDQLKLLGRSVAPIDIAVAGGLCRDADLRRQLRGDPEHRDRAEPGGRTIAESRARACAALPVGRRAARRGRDRPQPGFPRHARDQGRDQVARRHPRGRGVLRQRAGTGRSSVMRRPFVAQDDAAAGLRLAVRLAHHQHLDMAGQARDLAVLARDGIAQVVDRADEVRDAFFEGMRVGHGGLRL